MHVAIDLGEKYTYLVCWEKGKPLADACIRVRIPGLEVFNYNNNKYFHDRDGMRDYFFHLYQEYLLPSRIMVESAAVSLTSILNLNTRRMLLDVLEEVLGLPDVSIIPQPIALVYGCYLRNPHLTLTGDIVVIQIQETELDFAFLSITATGSIILERHFTGDISRAKAEADLIGFHSWEGWKIDSLLLGEEPPYSPEIEDFIDSLPKDVNIISEQNLQFASAEGLSWKYKEHTANLTDQISLIYPYEFYIETFNPNQNINKLVKIPFDTANLELNTRGTYRIFTLDSSSIYNLASDQYRVKFHIYESDTSNGSSQYGQTASQNLILEIDSFKSDLPKRMHLYLDMAAASLRLDLKPVKEYRTPSSPVEFHGRLLADQRKLFDLMKSNNYHPKLIDDFENHLLSAKQESKDLTDQIELTLFRLYALLQLWRGK
jgi:hypothetical protein